MESLDDNKAQAAPQSADLDAQALFYHRYPRPGKMEISATKPLGNQRDLALAYSPVSPPCLAIKEDPATAAFYTARSNLVAVVSNGTAVLGLGNIGALASKPVMEGKAVLFKKFAALTYSTSRSTHRPWKTWSRSSRRWSQPSAGSTLKTSRRPNVSRFERQLREIMDIPVFHDDQHGTAIIVAAAVLNGLELAGKDISKVKIVASGAGAAALACLNLLVALGARRENIWVHDIEGLVYKGREALMDEWKAVYAQDSDKRALADSIGGADIFLGLSAPAS